MYTKEFNRSGNVISRRVVTFSALLCLMVCSSNVAVADFAAVGDVTSSLGTGNAAVDEAGGTADDLIIGDEGTGGLLADGVAPFIGTLAALESNSVIIGNQLGSIGAANIEDFLGTDGNWIISGDFVVGHAGLGFLDFLNASGVQGAPSSVILGTTYVGGGNGIIDPAITALSTDDPRLGEGIVRINGLGSRLTTQALIVGGAGVGVIEASGRSQLDTLDFVEIGSTANIEGAFGDGTISLTDLGTRWIARAPVTVGGVAGASHGKIVIANQAVFQVDGVTTTPVPSTGTLTINPRGRVELAGGTLRMLPQATGNIITNNGLILGDGFIDGGIANGATGEIRNAAGVANEREYLLVSEAVTNAGLIESIGGEMEFEQLVTNTKDIVVRDAIMRFRGSEAGTTADLDNSGGRLILGGNATVYGTIIGPGAIFSVKGTDLTVGPPTIFGDVLFTEPGTLVAASSDGEVAAATSGFEVGFDISNIGNDVGLSIFGDVDLGGVASLSIDIEPGIDTAIGDVLQVLSISGNITGDFANEQLAADGYLWDINIVGGEVLVTADSLISNLAGDFDGDGDVDGSDFLAWQRGPATAAGLSDWQNDYDSGSSSFAATSAVPEPSTLVLALLTLVCCPRRRRLS